MTNTLNKIVHNGDEYMLPSGEVGVSDQANNIFTPGMKIWGGTQSDYQSLTPDSNTAYLLLADQPTPGRLPSAYQEIEYITSSGTQWINTQLSPSNTLSIEFAITPSGSNQTENAILGDEWDANAIFLMFYSNKYRFHNGGAAGVSVDGPTAQTGVKTTIKLDNTGMTIDGILYSLIAGNTYANNYKIGLFGTGGGYQTNRKGAFSLWETVIKDSGTAVRDLVPCYRKSDSVVGMYDTVNDVFYTNDGTGTFTAGPDVN